MSTLVVIVIGVPAGMLCLWAVTGVVVMAKEARKIRGKM